MFARNNTRWSHLASRALLLAALTAACTETSAPELDRVVAIEIRATPDVDTLHLADSLALSVWADMLTPLSVRWIIEPNADTIVADSLVYHPPGPGTALVRAVATFSENRVGVAARRVVTPPNGAPTGMNRAFISVILGGFGGEVAGPAGGAEQLQARAAGRYDRRDGGVRGPRRRLTERPLVRGRGWFTEQPVPGIG